MLKGALVGALALTVGIMAVASAEPRTPSLPSYDNIAPSIPRVTEANIARLKSVLNLTPQQVPHWNAVESALRALAREQRNTNVFANDPNASAIAAAGVLSKMRHLASVAAPLIQSLDDAQRREAMSLMQRLGYERLVAAF